MPINLTKYVKLDARIFHGYCTRQCVLPLEDAYVVAKVMNEIDAGRVEVLTLGIFPKDTILTIDRKTFASLMGRKLSIPVDDISLLLEYEVLNAQIWDD